MANATIKITNLPNIGNGLSTTSIFPVVANVNQTDKVTLGSVGNLILTEAGNTLEPAFLSELAYSVSNAAQPNITSVGTLTSLSVSGNANIGNIGTAGLITATGNIQGANLVTPGVLSVTGNANIGNIGVSGLITATTLSTTGNANVGRLNITTVANLKVGGGVDGYVLQTDGAGNLTWTAQTGGGGGNGSPGGANTQIQFNDAGSFGGNSGFTFNKVAGALASPLVDTASVYHLNGLTVQNADLTHGATAALIIPANGNSTIPAQINNTYGNVIITTGINSGQLKNWTFDNTGNLTLPSNSFAINYANGAAVPLDSYGNSNVATFLASYGSNTITTTGNVNVGNLITTGVSSATGNVRGGNLNTEGIVSATGNVIGGNLTTAGIVSATGNIQGANLLLGDNTKGLIAWDTNSTGVITDISGDLTGIYLVKNAQVQVYANGNVELYSNTSGAGYLWNFDRTGNLTLPTNTSSINYANGQPYGGGGGANTANVTFSDNIVQGRPGFGLGLAPTPDDTANLKYLQVRAGDIDSHIHFDTGNNNAYDQYFGDDNKYLKLEAGIAGNVLIGTYQDGGIGQIHWTYDSNGNLILPENGRIKAAGNTIPFSTTITNITSGSTTVVVTTTDNIFPGEYSGQVTISNVNPPLQANGTWWYLAVESNQFQLYYDEALTLPVDGTSWPGYVDGGDAVSVGSEMTIMAGNVIIGNGIESTWTFDVNGIFNLPTNGVVKGTGPTPVNLVSNNFVQMQWVDNGNINITDPNSSQGPINWVYVDNDGFHIESNINYANSNVAHSWGFNTDGSFTIPSGNATNIVQGQIFSGNENGFINLDVQFNSNVLGGVRLGTSATKPVDIVTGNGSGYNTLRFDSAGNLIIPGNVNVVGTASGDVTNEGGIPGVMGSQTLNAALSTNPIISAIEPGWTVTGNNLTTTTLVTSVVETSPGVYEITTDTTETNPFWYNDTYVLAGTSGFKTWTFDSVGNLTIPGNISARGGANVGFAFSGDITNITTGNPTVVVVIDSNPFPDPVSGQVTITGVSGTTEANGTWWFEAVMWNAFQLYTDETLTTPVDGTTWTAYAGGGFADNGGIGNISITANSVSIVTTSNSTWTFNSNGSTIFPTLTVDLHNGGVQDAQTLQFGDINQQAVITGPTPALNTNAERLIIQGQRGSGTGEGGDVYFWAGDSDVNGGDIKIYAGDADVSGYGGYINLDGGSGVNGGGQITITGGQSSAGAGGQITITPGYSGNGNGALLSLNGGQGSNDGGNVNITAGYGGANGGQVTITGGQSALGLPGYGNVVVQAGASSWTFDNGGNLTVPGEGIIQSINDTVILRSVDANSNIYSARLGTNGGLYFETTAYPTGWLSLTNNSGNANITAATGTAGGAGKHIIINAGDADQSDFYTSAGGNINIKGGLGAFNDGGGGGPGGSINLIAGNSSDPAGVSGSINITSGPNVWTFNNIGQLIAIGDIGNSVPNLIIGGGSEPFITSDLGSGPGNLGLVSNYLNLSGYTGAKVSIYADDGEIGATGNIVLTANNNGSANTWTFAEDGNLTVAGNIIFNSNIYINNGFTLSTLSDIGGQVDYNNRTMGYVADNNGTASLYARDSAGLGNHNAVITANGASGTALIRTSNEALTNYDWTYGSAGTLTLPTISLGDGIDEQSVVQSQRKVIPPYRYSAVIDGSTPTIVYTAKQDSMTIKTTLVVQHGGGVGFEMFDVSAVGVGSNVIYSVSNRLNGTGQPDTTAVVDWEGFQLAITLTINSGATTSWVTYDSTEFGIAFD